VPGGPHFFLYILLEKMNQNVINTIKDVSEPLVNEEGLFLVDVEIKHQKTPELWVLVDTEKDGVILDACSRISRKLANIIEDENLISSSYRLNVSSPGLSRPLSDIRQYRKNIGRQAKIKFKNEDGYNTREGELIQADETIVKIVESETGVEQEIPFDAVVETKIIPKI
jgi:ribosome maturation factor RimP